MSFTTDYEVKECVRVSQRVRVVLSAIAVDSAGGDAGDDLELYGRIWAEGTNAATLFDKNADNFVQIREGTQFGQGTPIAEAVISVSPKAGETIRLRANLTDADGFLNPDDAMGNETVLLPFETGWRKESTATLTGDSARIRIVYSLSPI